MSHEKDVFRMKRIRAHPVELSDFDGVFLTDETKAVIRESKLASLQDLLEPDPKAALHRLAERYWTLR